MGWRDTLPGETCFAGKTKMTIKDLRKEINVSGKSLNVSKMQNIVNFYVLTNKLKNVIRTG